MNQQQHVKQVEWGRIFKKLKKSISWSSRHGAVVNESD